MRCGSSLRTKRRPGRRHEEIVLLLTAAQQAKTIINLIICELARGPTSLVTMPHRPRVLIVGAGIAGLTLAAGLERQGIDPTIVEIANSSLSRGLALLLTSNVGVALRRIGLDSAVIQHGAVLEQILQTDASETPTAIHDLCPANER